MTNTQIIGRLRAAGTTDRAIPASDPGNRAKRFLEARTMSELRALANAYGLTFNEAVAEHKRAFKARWGV